LSSSTIIKWLTLRVEGVLLSAPLKHLQNMRLILCLLVLISSYGSTFAVELSKDGKTTCVIVLAADAIPSERTAAEQLQKYLQEVTGASFQIAEESGVPPGRPRIFVGAGAEVKKLLPDVDWAALGSDGVVIKAVGPDIVLAGGRPRGTLYSVFQFLEDSVGCRWWTPSAQTILRKASLSVEVKDVVYRPPFDYRENYTTEIIHNAIFAVMMRDNGEHAMVYGDKPSEDWGGHYAIIGAAHTWSLLLPVDTYFASHPEWYPDPANGFRPSTASSAKPKPNTTQLCLSNPEAVEELSKNALEWIRKDPSAGYISISENDNPGYCKCEMCAALAEKEGSQSGPVVNFVNQVAANIAKEYPDFKVETLAYRGSVKAPKTIRPADNVLIRMAPLQADFGHPMDSDWNGGHWAVSENVRDGLKQWAKMSNQLFMWTYTTNYLFSILPHPNWEGLAKDLRFFAANNVKGVFAQGDTFTYGVGDMLPLRTWLVSRLLWNPQLDQQKLMTEFLNGYYGPAGPYLEKYIALIQSAFLAQNRPLSSYNGWYDFLTLEAMNEATKLFDAAAESVKDDPILLRRVRLERLSLNMMWLYRCRPLKQVAAVTGSEFLGPKNPAREVLVFAEAGRYFGLHDYAERNPRDPEIERLSTLHLPPTAIPEEISAHIRPGTDQAKDVIDARPYDCALVQVGKWTSVVKDEGATNLYAGRLGTNSIGWAMQLMFDNYGPDFLGEEKWHIYVRLRAETKSADRQSPVVNLGLWTRGKSGDPGVGQLLSTQVKAGALEDQKYHWQSVGTHEIPPQYLPVRLTSKRSPVKFAGHSHSGRPDCLDPRQRLSRVVFPKMLRLSGKLLR